MTLPLIALAAVAVWRAHDQARAWAETELLGRARTLATMVDRDIQRVETGLRALADSGMLAQRNLAGIEAEMRAMSAQLDGAPIALVASPGIEVLSTYWMPGERRQDIPAPPVTAETLATGQMVISGLVTGCSHDCSRRRPVAAVVLPAPPQGTPAFAFLAGLPQGGLAAALQERPVMGAETAVATVIDRNAVILARTRAEAALQGEPIWPELAARMAAEAEGLVHAAPTHEGVPATLAFARAPHSGFTVALSLPEAEFVAPMRTGLQRFGLLAAAFLIAGAGLAALLARRIAMALQGLTAAAMPDRLVLREVDTLARAMAERDRAMQNLAASERRFRALAEAGALVVWRGDANGTIREGLGWGRFSGQAPTALREGGWIGMLHPAERDSLLAAWEKARRTGSGLDVELRILTHDGGWRWVRTRGVPLRHAEGEPPTEWIGVVEDVHERRQAAQLLEEREKRLRLAVEAARLTTWEYDPVTDCGSRIAATGDALLVPSGTGITLAGWLASIHPEDRPRVHATIQEVIDGRNNDYEVEFRARRAPPCTGWAWVISRGAVTERHPETGVVLRITGVSQDISERREAEQRRILLAREVNHRAKNVLAVVQSVLRLSRRDSPEAFIEAVEARVTALARAHNLLAAEGWAAADLRSLAQQETSCLPPGTASFDGPTLAVAAAAVQPLAMVLHELATNAAKHGAATRPEGRVALHWAVEDGALRLDWIERGGPPVAAPPRRHGFGSRMLEAILRRQLGGTLALEWAGAGLECCITLPAGRVLAATSPAAAESCKAAPVA